MEANKPFYEEWWFWVCLTVIILCITKRQVITIAGNENGNANRA